MCNEISHSAFCQHLNEHQGSIIASIFTWASGSGRFLLLLQKFKWPTLFKEQRMSQNLFCLFHSCKTKLWIVVTRCVRLNAGSLNEVHSLKGVFIFQLPFPSLESLPENLLGQKLLRGLLFLAILWISYSRQPSFWNN